jgi:hypothetical protein
MEPSSCLPKTRPAHHEPLTNHWFDSEHIDDKLRMADCPGVRKVESLKNFSVMQGNLPVSFLNHFTELRFWTGLASRDVSRRIISMEIYMTPLTFVKSGGLIWHWREGREFTARTEYYPLEQQRKCLCGLSFRLMIVLHRKLLEFSS